MTQDSSLIESPDPLMTLSITKHSFQRLSHEIYLYIYVFPSTRHLYIHNSKKSYDYIEFDRLISHLVDLNRM